MPDEVSVVGLPVPGIAGIDYRTSEQDWVVTGVYRGQPFRRYVSSHSSMDEALQIAAVAQRLTPDGLEWISARRRHEVERCIRADGDWLRLRAR